MSDESGVALFHYLYEQTPPVGVRFTCNGCEASHDVPTEAVIERLKARGLGDEWTGVREVARFAERPCARCGAMRWDTRPAWRVK